MTCREQTAQTYIAKMDPSAYATASGTSLGTRTAGSASTRTASAPEAGAGPLGAALPPLLWEEDSARP